MAAKSDEGGDSKRRIKISELPVYGNPDVKVKVLPEDIGKFREGISVVRGAVWNWLDSIQGTTEKVKDTYEIGKAHTQSTVDYIQNDEGVLPRLAVIGVSGLAGIVLGYKGGPMRKAAFSTFAVISATSLCYPKEAVALTTGQYEKLRNKVQELRGKSDSDDKSS
ncbi:MICOS complex subunit MIC27-like isoform X1 [Mercenaria mercenaria]|uniref:MICOS complex subunit MIC27-like isoform X1 n=1 Tax=Mercenaria mercenaria TaxID=6596 RepID=UPI00234EA634|nr:MICOS complex subunit MIC27-like isoform X1 [Mercenaria mercenaria]